MNASLACVADSAAEQAESYETHGPLSQSVYEIRPEATERLLPVAAYTLPPAGDAIKICSKSFERIPTKTPVKLLLSSDRLRYESCSDE